LDHVPLVRGSARCAPQDRLAIFDGRIAFLVLIAAEFALGGVVFGRQVGEQLAAYGSVAGAISLAAQIVFAMFPVMQIRRR
jgi:hypothetical protein